MQGGPPRCFSVSGNEVVSGSPKMLGLRNFGMVVQYSN